MSERRETENLLEVRSIMIGGYQDLVALAQVIVIDVALAGDNAIVIGLAASRVPLANRTKVIFWGIAGAVIIRVVFAALVTELLAIIGLTLAGGILLLWVCWKMFREFRRPHGEPADATGDKPAPHLRNAITQIIVADLSMSLDNVLAVAGAAKGNLTILFVGLGLSIVLTAIAANLIARWLARYPWIAWLGLAVVLYVAIEMIWRGVHEVVSATTGS
jgi:YjbE family integral membrane protein